MTKAVEGNDHGSRVIADRSRSVTYASIVDAARDIFLSCETVDMNDLARRLAISRSTLYRVAVTRERVLSDVVWSLGAISLRYAIQHTAGPMDLQRFLEIGERFRDAAVRSEPMGYFVKHEPSTAAVALHTPSSARDELLAGWRDLLLEGVATRHSDPVIDPSHAAEIIVSLGASMLYRDLVSGARSNPDLVAVVLRALFVTEEL